MNSLYGWRGIGALLVVAFHTRMTLEGAIPVSAHTQFLNKGYLWVDMFFLLSGYTLSRNYFARFAGVPTRAAQLEFVALRLAHIYPLHLLMIAFMLIALLATGQPLERKYSIVSLATNVLLVQAWGMHDQLTWNISAWALSTLFAAYLAFPWLAAGLHRWPCAGRAIVLAGACGSLFALERSYGNLDVTYDFGLVRCLSEFAIGVLLARLRPAHGLSRLSAHAAIQWPCVIAMTAALHFSAPDLVTVALMALVIVAFGEDHGRLARLMRATWLVRLGELSFSIYVVHYPVGRLLRGQPMLLERLVAGDAPLVALARFLESMAIFVAVAWALHRWYETPVRERVRAALRRLRHSREDQAARASVPPKAQDSR